MSLSPLTSLNKHYHCRLYQVCLEFDQPEDVTVQKILPFLENLIVSQVKSITSSVYDPMGHFSIILAQLRAFCSSMIQRYENQDELLSTHEKNVFAELLKAHFLSTFEEIPRFVTPDPGFRIY